jgi:hypothetical protein
MSQALFDRFEVSPQTAEDAVAGLMRDLKNHKLITLPEARFL